MGKNINKPTCINGRILVKGHNQSSYGKECKQANMYKWKSFGKSKQRSTYGKV